MRAALTSCFLLAALGLALLPAPVRAMAAESACWDDDPQCDAIEDFADASAENISAYQTQMKYLTSADSREWLKTSHTQWNNFATEACSYETSGMNGDQRKNTTLCMTRLLREETDRLKSYMECRSDGCPN